MTVNCFTDNDIKLILYADDTNIFITGGSRQNLIEKPNNVLIKVNKFIKSNLLNINLGKCNTTNFFIIENFKIIIKILNTLINRK